MFSCHYQSHRFFKAGIKQANRIRPWFDIFAALTDSILKKEIEIQCLTFFMKMKTDPSNNQKPKSQHHNSQYENGQKYGQSKL